MRRSADNIRLIYALADPKLAYVEPAKQLALMAVDMPWDDAQERAAPWAGHSSSIGTTVSSGGGNGDGVSATDHRFLRPFLRRASLR